MLKALRDAPVLRLALLPAVLAGLVLASLMSVSPELHGWFHHDADHAQHECLVTLMDAGGCDHDAPAPVLATFHAVLIATVPMLHPQFVEPLFLDGGVLEHAPPVIS